GAGPGRGPDAAARALQVAVDAAAPRQGPRIAALERQRERLEEQLAELLAYGLRRGEQQHRLAVVEQQRVDEVDRRQHARQQLAGEVVLEFAALARGQFLALALLGGVAVDRQPLAP